MLTLLGTSICKMVGITTSVALTTVSRCSRQVCLRWRLFIAFGLIILNVTWYFTQVGMLACILIGMATLFANNTPPGIAWAPWYQGAHQGAH
jgi:hypothetical protein